MQTKQRKYKSIEIVKADIDCIDTVKSMYISCFSYPYGCAFFEKMLDDVCGFCYILRSSGKDCGFIYGCFIYDEVHIINVCVLDKYRRRGFATILIKKAIDVAVAENARSVILEVSVENISALSLYEKIGFERIGIRRGYYIESGRRIDAYVYKVDT